jgi:hypothetical protein
VATAAENRLNFNAANNGQQEKSPRRAQIVLGRYRHQSHIVGEGMTGLVATRLTLLCVLIIDHVLSGFVRVQDFLHTWRIRQILLQATRIIMEQSGALFDKDEGKRTVVT